VGWYVYCKVIAALGWPVFYLTNFKLGQQSVLRSLYPLVLPCSRLVLYDTAGL